MRLLDLGSYVIALTGIDATGLMTEREDALILSSPEGHLLHMALYAYERNSRYTRYIHTEAHNDVLVLKELPPYLARNVMCDVSAEQLTSAYVRARSAHKLYTVRIKNMALAIFANFTNVYISDSGDGYCYVFASARAGHYCYTKIPVEQPALPSPHLDEEGYQRWAETSWFKSRRTVQIPSAFLRDISHATVTINADSVSIDVAAFTYQYYWSLPRFETDFTLDSDVILQAAQLFSAGDIYYDCTHMPQAMCKVLDSIPRVYTCEIGLFYVYKDSFGFRYSHPLGYSVYEFFDMKTLGGEIA